MVQVHFLLWLAPFTSLARSSQEVLVLEAEESDWDTLSTAVGGRLFQGVPFAKPCFTIGFDSSECAAVRSAYLEEATRSTIATAYMQVQWETCQTSQTQQCLLSSINPNDPSPAKPTRNCSQGSVPERFIDVKYASDVKAAFRFSRSTGTPLVIKNTGHDYSGRSSAPRSLALWTHNLKDISYNPAFVPRGCSKVSPGVTVGAGVQWHEAYTFAEANNITLVGGSDGSVGVSGGWLQGGGDGMLSSAMGLGADRVLQFKVVTPDGRFRVANACRNQDLFFALRGGGGGTFGVVLESTILVSPQITLQVATLTFDPSPDRNKEMWTIFTDNGLRWAAEEWGGSSKPGFAILVRPGSNSEDAAKSIEPLIQFSKRPQREGVTGVRLTMTQFPSWGSFFVEFSSRHTVVGQNVVLASRRIDRKTFKQSDTRSTLISGLLAADKATPGLVIYLTSPTSPPSDGNTSITAAWRSSIYHVVVSSMWDWNATVQEKRGHYTAVSDSIDNLRKITPDAAYSNEADVYEPDHETAFWGEHYPELLRIKKKYDPYHLLDCWHCVGSNPGSSRFNCYL